MLSTLCFERLGICHRRGGRLLWWEKHCKQNRGSMNIARCLGTEERVHVAEVKLKHRGPCRGRDTGCESSGELML